MIERITPAEVRGLAYWLEMHGAHLGDEYPNSRYIYEAPFFAKAKRVCILADQMEADECKTANIQEAWQELGAEIARLKDALSAYNAVINLLPVNVSPSEWLRDMVAERDELAAKVQEYEARLKGRVWRPFDTAPQDETEILVYRPDAEVFTARYYPSLNEDDEWDLDNYCWFTMAGEDLTRDLPTHWMPLPDGPDQTIDEEERYEKG